MPKVTIRVHIFSYIFVLVALIIALFSGMQYYFSKQMATEATMKNFHLIASEISLEIAYRDQLSKEILSQMQNYPEITKPLKRNLNLALMKRYIYTLKRSQNITSIYSANANDDIIEVLNIANTPTMHAYFDAPKGSCWLAFMISGKDEARTKKLFFFNKDLEQLATRSEVSTFYPTERVWYKMARNSEHVVRTKPYYFETLDTQGVTYAKKVDGSKTVIALDLSLAGISKRLNTYSFAETSAITLFDSNAQVVASTRSHVSKDIISTFLKNPQKHMMQLKLKDAKHFVMVSQVSDEEGYKTYLGVSVLKDELLKPYTEKIMYALLAALLLFVLSIPAILFATNLIVRPLYGLMEQNKKIRKRRFEEVSEVHTNIIELDRLSKSLVSMSQSIKTYQEAQKELMDSFIKLIAGAIDAKSPYTGGHCRRVPLIATMLVKEASKASSGSLKTFTFDTPEELEEFERGAWLHDCGKITTPEYVVDKATKLETIYNRLHEVRMRFEVLWRDISIVALERELKGEEASLLKEWREKEQAILLEEFAFIAESNVGGEFMDEVKKERVQAIAKRTWTRHFSNRLGLSANELLRYSAPECSLPTQEQLLSDKNEHIIPRVNFDEAGYIASGFKLTVPEHLYNYGEVYNLCIERGTLSEEERFKIQEHVIMSIKMLEQLPFTEDMKRIPEYAGTHHETLVGNGYPRELSANELSIPARIMAIADIFEALTASDRPYKKGKTLSQAMKIMHFMVKDQHIDGELFALFLRSGIYKVYAQEHLKVEQIDEVDIEALL